MTLGNGTPRRDAQRLWIATFGIVFVVLLPIANSAGLLSDYYLNLFGKYLCLALLAVGMDLIWGYTGILSLGQAIFFGVGRSEERRVGKECRSRWSPYH